MLYSCSEEEFVQQVVSRIDPNRIYFKDVLTKKHSIWSHIFSPEGSLIKEAYLKEVSLMLNVSLDRCLLVDNSPLNLMCHLKGAIPILPYLGSSEDQELKKLAKYLISLSDSCPVLDNDRYFSLDKFLPSRGFSPYLQNSANMGISESSKKMALEEVAKKVLL